MNKHLTNVLNMNSTMIKRGKQLMEQKPMRTKWKIERQTNGVVYVTDETGQTVCDLYHMGSDGYVIPKAHANTHAAQIVLVPEMILALRQLAARFDQISEADFSLSCTMRDVRSILEMLDRAEPKYSAPNTPEIEPSLFADLHEQTPYHRAVRQGDEMFCSVCGKRWPADDDDAPECVI